MNTQHQAVIVINNPYHSQPCERTRSFNVDIDDSIILHIKEKVQTQLGVLIDHQLMNMVIHVHLPTSSPLLKENCGKKRKIDIVEIADCGLDSPLPSEKEEFLTSRDNESPVEPYPIIETKLQETSPLDRVRVTEKDIKTGHKFAGTNHEGNKFYHDVINTRKDQYMNAKPSEKKKIIGEIHDLLNNDNRRFVTLVDEKRDVWKVLSDSDANKKKIAQALRERRNIQKQGMELKRQSSLPLTKQTLPTMDPWSTEFHYHVGFIHPSKDLLFEKSFHSVEAYSVKEETYEEEVQPLNNLSEEMNDHVHQSTEVHPPNLTDNKSVLEPFPVGFSPIISLPEFHRGAVEVDQRAVHQNDILCGSGGGVHLHHPGNQYLRLLVNRLKGQYAHIQKKSDKMLLAKSIIRNIQGLQPPGRFLQKNGDVWEDIGEEKALKKICQALREQHHNIALFQLKKSL
mmetsp:Transcript_19190/g.28748  ORF Transcript_19190/g.28748 Transcript_19190/m.28748 type:complete len:455 (+) Transcript_19190:173-1537(+)|eukprot:CAMPEP_0203674232 /NCGR_PEP_ID=MMETSP0090-20130426/15410_1 /ASSEMBLY_ACC=CAM_ASM_001088 /TAXON_ID=426623 /ORGANISM="Chaetoceros affinis, Strain CCMP159" /LENGTH=454 /DNA_ID=CAMNT_0050540053 /DNA_START=110 /DNA_END=1474 /DNA_ORIENTATION=-